MYNKILVSVDTSSVSKRALHHAFQLARSTGSKLTVLYVQQIILFYYGALGPEGKCVSLSKLEGEDILNNLLQELDINPASVCQRTATGNSALLIPAIAKEEKVNLIVLGIKNFGILSSILQGNTQQTVLKYAPCPVLIVK